MTERVLAVMGVVWLAGAGGCGNACDHPDEQEYSCEPVAPGTPNSCGGPTFDGMAYDQDKAFPKDCTVRLPMCVSAYPGYVQTCTCSDAFGSLMWVCPV